MSDRQQILSVIQQRTASFSGQVGSGSAAVARALEQLADDVSRLPADSDPNPCLNCFRKDGGRFLSLGTPQAHAVLRSAAALGALHDRGLSGLTGQAAFLVSALAHDARLVLGWSEADAHLELDTQMSTPSDTPSEVAKAS